jgi:NAD(P)-dependent dehydrogenase (short-subunit alcohol dehydrogenase family)
VPGFSGATALVTGASRGIGRAVAVALAAEGCRLALVARDRAALEASAELCAQAAPEPGADPLALVADLTSAEERRVAAAQALEALGGRLHLLANVAGSAMRRAPLEQLEDSDWERSLALHLIAPAQLGRQCRPALAAARGAIVNVGSIAAARGSPMGAAYAAAKAALVSLTKTAAVEWAADGVRANVVEPAYVDTGFNAPLVEAGMEPRLLGKMPTGRVIRPEAVARAVLYVGSPDNVDVTGTVMRVDGGWTARL